MKNKFYIIINPNAGRGAAYKSWPDIKKHLDASSFIYEYEFIEDPNHCRCIVQHRINEGYRRFLCVGGDGTLNLILNGIFKQDSISPEEIYLGHIPMGTGNDWRKYFKLPSDTNEAIEIIKKENSLRQDVGKLSYYDNGKKHSVYFLNIAGIGFDAEIAYKTNMNKSRGNRTANSYLFSLFKTLMKFKYIPLRISINGECLEKDFLSISIGNGKYSGGGMLQTPNAVIDDGLLDITIFEKISKSRILFSIRKLYNGNIYSEKKAVHYRTKNISVESETPFLIETDGETVPPINKVEISIIPKSLNVYV